MLRRYHLGFDVHQLATTGLRLIVPIEARVACWAKVIWLQVGQGMRIVLIGQAPRAGLSLLMSASLWAGVMLLPAVKSLTATSQRSYIIPDDVKIPGSVDVAPLHLFAA